jgi:hypothetical protein
MSAIRGTVDRSKQVLIRVGWPLGRRSRLSRDIGCLVCGATWLRGSEPPNQVDED